MNVSGQSEQNVDKLNSLLKGEISAVETYRQALDKVKDVQARSELEECARSHQSRVQTLRDRIQQMGGTPANSSGAWGTFAKLVEGVATPFGDKAAIAALEEGEDHGLADYRREIPALDGDSRSFVEAELLPAQERTHRALSTLKKTMN
ncbi:MAG TPA: DUF2383 domain-containing protein [Myxococcaceae bacterium]|nr:DUF2383 domain-containing protein [Myxococcaceae bacterium]